MVTKSASARVETKVEVACFAMSSSDQPKPIFSPPSVVICASWLIE